ncbi:MAG: pilin [Xanthomonadales bacterium]|nr:pilin [Xanthomonadales bacterium]
MNITKKQMGFTLIELMIVVAIIAILAAIAVPAYQNYLIRSQVSEAPALSGGAKVAISEFFSNHGHFPDTNVSAGLAIPASIVGKYITQVDVKTNAGKIQSTFGNEANDKITGKLFVLSAVVHSGSISWVCTASAGTNVDQKYLPSSCRD